MKNDPNPVFYVYVLLDTRKPGSFHYRGSNSIFSYEPFYIGKGRDRRIYEHRYEIRSKGHNRKINKIKAIFRETGNFHLEIKIFENLYLDQALETEKFLINQIGRIDHDRGPLTNGTDGGDGNIGAIQSEETKAKRRLLVGEKAARFGKPPWNKGLKLGPHSKNHNEKIRLGGGKNRGRVFGPASEEHKEKNRQGQFRRYENHPEIREVTRARMLNNTFKSDYLASLKRKNEIHENDCDCRFTSKIVV